VSDFLQLAISDSLPILRQIRGGFGPHPTASLVALDALKSLKSSGPLPGALASPQAAAAVPPVRAEPVAFGEGNPAAELMFVGEVPGGDQPDEPLEEEAAQLLTKIIQVMGYTREQVYIGNVLKSRPDLPWVEKQIALIKPRVLVALGATAAGVLLGQTEPIGKLRGRWLDFHGIPLMATYHPAYLVHNQSRTEKRKVWEDMLLVLEKLEKPISEKQRRFFTKAG